MNSEMENNLGYLNNLCRDFEVLEPFLTGCSSLKQDAASIVTFIGCYMKGVRVEIVRFGANGEIRESTLQESESLKEMLKGLNDSTSDGNSLQPCVMQDAGAEKYGDFYLYRIPISVSGNLAGAGLIFKDIGSGQWTEEEYRILKILSSMLEISFTNRRYSEDSKVQNWVLDGVMNNMQANLFVTDPNTDQILYMNRNMMETFGIAHPEGRVCYEVLQKGLDHRCSFCPVSILMKSRQENPSHVWESHNPVTGRIYENYDSLMKWGDGSLVHFQHSVDVTESRLLKSMASFDELTGLYNRRAGKEELQKTLDRVRMGECRAALCMFDVNGLKQVNDMYGHVEGDFLLVMIADAVKQILKEKEYAFRLSGDEFIIVFEEGTEEEAAAAMKRIERVLAGKKEIEGKPYEVSFCYGIIGISRDKRLNMKDVLGCADEEMYVQKRRYHIMMAEKKLKAEVSVKAALTSEFEYDKDHLYEALVKSTDDYIYICNMKTGIFLYTPAMVEEFGLPGVIVDNAAAVMGQKVHPDDRQIFMESNQEIADGRTTCHKVEYRLRNKRGEYVWVRCRGTLILDDCGKPSLFAGIITNLGRRNKVDYLTGLFNKYEFEQAIKDAIRFINGDTFGVMLLDLDEFHHINDLYNREFGDEVLRTTAGTIQGMLPENAALYRLDGDEFGILMMHCGEAELSALYARIHAEFGKQREQQGKRYFCSISAGCACYPKDAKNYLELFKCAGYSLEYAKKRGKNSLAAFSSEIEDGKKRTLEIIELLRADIDRDFEGFSLRFQPLVSADDGKLYGAEALARFECEEYGKVPPTEFIPLLEESGLIYAAGKWIFKEAAEACKRMTALNPEFCVSINLSYLQLNQPDFIPYMWKVLDELKLDPGHIIAELTESCMVSNINLLGESFDRIRRMGIRIAMDDFGTGYSSLEILKQCPADIVKIDRTFVKDIRNSKFDATFIQFIVALCHDVGIKVCLEGVETQEEYEVVYPMRLDLIQGYLFGMPLTEEELKGLHEKFGK